MERDRSVCRLHVVFNNVPYKSGLVTAWGFACLVETSQTTVLFDTGGNGDILLSNMTALGLDPAAIDVVVLSHIHGDHTGGLGTLLKRNADVTVYVPQSFPAAFQNEIERLGARTETVSGPRSISDGIHSTGEMGTGIKEQALIVDTPQGLVVITGCAHPGVAAMVEQASADLGKSIDLLVGGFHLGGSSGHEIEAIIERLKAVGVKRIAPSHCTGDAAIGRFRARWGADFIEGGLGAVIEAPQP